MSKGVVGDSGQSYQIRLIVYRKGRQNGYPVFEFCWAASRHAGAAAKNVPKIGQKISFLKKCLIGTTLKFFILHSNGPLGVPDVHKKIQLEFGFGQVRSCF